MSRNIEDETPILPWVVAESAIAHTPGANKLLSRDEAIKYAELLSDDANVQYKRNATFRKKVKGPGNTGRDYLYSFM